MALYRHLAARAPDAFEPDPALSLNNRAALLAEFARPQGAVAALGEAAAVCRRLAARYPDAYEPKLVVVLRHLSQQLAALGRREEARAAAGEAVTVCRRLAGRQSALFAPELARCLVLEGHLTFGADAVRVFGEALRVPGPHAAASPAEHGAFARSVMQHYVAGCLGLGREPDLAVLAPVMEAVARLEAAGKARRNDSGAPPPRAGRSGSRLGFLVPAPLRRLLGLPRRRRPAGRVPPAEDRAPPASAVRVTKLQLFRATSVPSWDSVPARYLCAAPSPPSGSVAGEG